MLTTTTHALPCLEAINAVPLLSARYRVTPPSRPRQGRCRLKIHAVDEDGAEQAEMDVEARLGIGRRSRRRKAKKAAAARPKTKDWETMTLSEKAWEMYAGEKGILFWFNKIAFASIFVMIGGWILFRFIGPSLGLYQLESPLLPPDEVFRGSS